MKYVEFEKYQEIKDPSYPLFNAYASEEGDVFYIEPMFYQSMLGYKDKTVGRFEAILEEMDRIVKQNHKVIFTYDFEHPQILKEGFIYRELEDITNLLHITWRDDSRPSDYGD